MDSDFIEGFFEFVKLFLSKLTVSGFVQKLAVVIGLLKAVGHIHPRLFVVLLLLLGLGFRVLQEIIGYLHVIAD